MPLERTEGFCSQDSYSDKDQAFTVEFPGTVGRFIRLGPEVVPLDIFSHGPVAELVADVDREAEVLVIGQSVTNIVRKDPDLESGFTTVK